MAVLAAPGATAPVLTVAVAAWQVVAFVAYVRGQTVVVAWQVAALAAYVQGQMAAEVFFQVAWPAAAPGPCRAPARAL